MKESNLPLDISVKVLNVDLKDRAYPIYIGEDLLARDLLSKYIADSQVLIVTNETIAPLYLNLVKSQLQSVQCDEIILPDGEAHKNMDTLNRIFNVLVEHQHRRNTTLIALGGGVVGDLTGFAAACYQRGVAFIQFPTSLLAQVDASVGGKTAINHPLGKNLIGAFYQPKAVLIDINTLATLSEREFLSGLAEIIKASLIANPEFFSWLENHMEHLVNREKKYLIQAISEAVAIKVGIVVTDEREQGRRALLNFGHTFAHGIERSMGYGTWLHGEAVAVGLVLACSLSQRLGFISNETKMRVENLLTKAKLPIRLPVSLSVGKLIESMEMDKKKESKELTFILLKGIGNACKFSNISRQLLEEVIEERYSR